MVNPYFWTERANRYLSDELLEEGMRDAIDITGGAINGSAEPAASDAREDQRRRQEKSDEWNDEQ
ncbi:hypothetical protein BN2475_450139 [Paraburkholderia ribeironis]|uniref:Uncharacterized protein n=1 Tax=Paraburkholderia ribeironis TaxID=1247936 RepID=A0A1N7S9A8_9BURK|nr:hypothetical protein BN2475_450139 [Paraburkholderia ribeironis]